MLLIHVHPPHQGEARTSGGRRQHRLSSAGGDRADDARIETQTRSVSAAKGTPGYLPRVES